MKGKLYLILFIAISSVAIFFLVRGCSGNISPQRANLVLKRDGKQYVFSNMGEFIVKTSIDKGESPAVMSFLNIYKDDDLICLDPNNMQEVINVMAGDILTYDYKEESSDGYIVSAKDLSNSMSIHMQSTKKIGEQLTVFEYTLKNKSGKTMNIKWSSNSKTGVRTPISNCKNHSFWFQTNISPGETATSLEDHLVVDIKDLAAFFGMSYEYDKEGGVLYIY